MGSWKSLIPREYRRCLEQPLSMIAMMLMLAIPAGFYATDFRLDASSDTLVADSDPELQYFRELGSTFGTAPFLVMTYRPLRGDLFSEYHIERLTSLQDSIQRIEGVAGVTSILDAPLIDSPPVPATRMATDFRTLRAGNADLTLAKAELSGSPLFAELLISRDGRTALIQITLDQAPALDAVKREVDDLRSRHSPSPDEHRRLAELNLERQRLQETVKQRQSEIVSELRDIREAYSADARIYLGGVPMIVADMIAYVSEDLTIFSAAIVLTIGIALWFFFRRLRWVVIPLATTGVSILLMVGLLGFLNKPITAISASFISLMAIITISFSIHLISRYRELRNDFPDRRHIDLVYDTMASKLAPCVYTALTTSIAFASLLTSDILPLVDFGSIMLIGVLVSLVVTYLFFASVLVLMSKGKVSPTLRTQAEQTRWFLHLTIRHPRKLLILTAVVVGLAGWSASHILLENRFIDYFESGSEIREGMITIDKELGGTLPMDIIVNVPPYREPERLEDDPFGADPFESESDQVDPRLYWFTPDKIELLRKLSAYLDSRPEIGKSISLANIEEVARGYNDGKPLGALEMVAVLSHLPDQIKRTIIDPYASPETGELRISTRIHETGPQFRKDDVIREIEQFAVHELGIAPGDVHVSGLAVLFNNMMAHLFSSQARTIGFVVLATFIMFIILMRSFALAIIGIVANLVTPILILGIIGALQIPLNLMTITIAAIVIGIGVDDAIHYLHRFREERETGSSVREAVEISHRGTGSALYFTSMTIIAGFSSLAFSNFVPTIQFGLLTAVAMALALFANLTVLPSMLLTFLPEKK